MAPAGLSVPDDYSTNPGWEGFNKSPDNISSEYVGFWDVTYVSRGSLCTTYNGHKD